MEGSFRFLNRVWNLVLENLDRLQGPAPDLTPEALSGAARALLIKLNQTVKKVTEDIEDRFHFNTAVSAIMELFNALYLFRGEGLDEPARRDVFSRAVETSILLLSPIVPHLAEELWARLEKPGTAQGRSWPAWDPRFLTEEERELVIQVNGKVRSRLTVRIDAAEAEIKEAALAQPRIREWLSGKEVVKIIVVQQKLVNIVIR